MMRIVLVLALLLAACTTTDNDRSTNFGRLVFDTRVNVEPVDRLERTRLLQLENHRYKLAITPLRARLKATREERAKFYAQIEQEFPECSRQRHCLATISKGQVHRFERYNELTNALRRYDFLIFDLETKIDDVEHDHDVNERRIYNRYLVHEMLAVKEFEPLFQRVMVHSLEAFPNREAISRRLLDFVDRDVYANQIGDYDFRMMGQPVNEGALVLVLDVLPVRTEARADQERFLAAFLVNTHQRDPQFYEQPFLREWTRMFSELSRTTLKREAFCGLYSIAGPTLTVKMQPSKYGACKETRERVQSLRSERFYDRFPGYEWLRPISFVQIARGEELY
jgi:hypothetical protein